jgi:hypothetical protein
MATTVKATSSGSGIEIAMSYRVSGLAGDERCGCRVACVTLDLEDVRGSLRRWMRNLCRRGERLIAFAGRYSLGGGCGIAQARAR